MEGHMRVMNPLDGDEHITWDPEKPETVEKAKKKFLDAIKKGHKAFKAVPHQTHSQGEQVAEFDPNYTEGYLLVPAMSGG